MPTNNSRKRAKIFDRGVAAYHRLSKDTEELYPCPTCLQLFDRAALNEGDLTLEHVPPEAVGGKGIRLTCKKCNNSAGTMIDAARAEFDKLRNLNLALASQTGKYEGSVKLKIGDTEVNATAEVAGDKITFHVMDERNNPEHLAAQNEHLTKLVESRQENHEFGVRASFRATPQQVFISNLRAAYLAAHALLGYSYICQAQLTVVREQIQDPEAKLVPRIAQQSARDAGLPQETMIFELTKPVPSIGVHLPPFILILPPVGGTGDFYAQLSAVLADAKLEGSAIAWPTGPAYWIGFKRE